MVIVSVIIYFDKIYSVQIWREVDDVFDKITSEDVVRSWQINLFVSTDAVDKIIYKDMARSGTIIVFVSTNFFDKVIKNTI